MSFHFSFLLYFFPQGVHTRSGGGFVVTRLPGKLVPLAWGNGAGWYVRSPTDGLQCSVKSTEIASERGVKREREPVRFGCATERARADSKQPTKKRRILRGIAVRVCVSRSNRNHHTSPPPHDGRTAVRAVCGVAGAAECPDRGRVRWFLPGGHPLLQRARFVVRGAEGTAERDHRGPER